MNLITQIFMLMKVYHLLFAYMLTWYHPNAKYMYEKSVKYVTLTNLIKHLLAFNSCSGVTNENAKKCAVSHSIPKKFNPNQIFNNPTMFYLSSDCLISCQAENCIKCKKKSSKRKKVNYSSQAKCPHFTNIWKHKVNSLIISQWK